MRTIKDEENWLKWYLTLCVQQTIILRNCCIVEDFFGCYLLFVSLGKERERNDKQAGQKVRAAGADDR